MTEDTSLREAVEQILAKHKRVLHPREIAAQLELDDDEYPELIRILDDLRQEGRLKLMPGGRVRAQDEVPKKSAAGAPPREGWEGTLTVNPRGFGFVASAGHEDVFIPRESIYEAMHGDTVRIVVMGHSAKGTDGRIEGITHRRSPKLSGVVRRRRAGSWIEPDDSRIRGPIELTGDVSSAQDGDSAIVEIVRFPDFADELPQAQLVEVLGPAGDLSTEVRKILLTAEVIEEHRPETLQNAEAIATALAQVKRQGRRDLRSVPLPTIDPEDARDHDDALWVERTATGYRAYIAIADVSEYVREGSALDEEAHERGCTIYLPDRAIPMLPRALAADLCSLLPEVDRYCLCVIADLDRRGQVRNYELVEGVMRSQARLTYDGVARALGLDPESPSSPAAEAMKDDLAILQELTIKLRNARMSRGALDLDLPEARVIVDDDTGAPIAVKKRAVRPGLKSAYSMVEEMMLLANELVARWFTKQEIPGIYRIHDLPDEEKLERLANVAKKLEIKAEVSQLRQALGASEFLKRAQSHPRSRALTMLLLRSLKQAVYDTGNVGHFGLASDAYVHFTSPIRRYPDLRVHRQIKKLLRGGRVDRTPAAMEDLQAAATDSSKKERAAMDVERQVLDLYRAFYMQRHIGDTFDGQVTGISGSGLYVSIDEPFCDVLIPFDALGLDQFETDEEEISVTAKRSGETIMLGDRLAIEVTDVAIGRRTVLGRRARTVDDELAGMEPWLDGAGQASGDLEWSTRPPGGESRRARPGTRGTSRGASGGTGRSVRPTRPGQRTRKDDSTRAEASQGKSFKPSRAAASRAGSKTSSEHSSADRSTGASRTGSARQSGEASGARKSSSGASRSKRRR